MYSLKHRLFTAAGGVCCTHCFVVPEHYSDRHDNFGSPEMRCNLLNINCLQFQMISTNSAAGGVYCTHCIVSPRTLQLHSDTISLPFLKCDV